MVLQTVKVSGDETNEFNMQQIIFWQLNSFVIATNRLVSQVLSTNSGRPYSVYCNKCIKMVHLLCHHKMIPGIDNIMLLLVRGLPV